MTFDAWTRAFVDGGRRHLPDARATRKGPRVVIIRHGERVAQLEMLTVSAPRLAVYGGSRISLERKRRIVELTLRAGASVLAIAREHGVRPNSLHRWRTLYRAGKLDAQILSGPHVASPAASATFVPVSLISEVRSPQPAAHPDAAALMLKADRPVVFALYAITPQAMPSPSPEASPGASPISAANPTPSLPPPLPSSTISPQATSKSSKSIVVI
jgi:hypothetical protein